MSVSTIPSRRGYEAIALYAPDRRPCAIDLSDNTNLWGAPPAAMRAIGDAAASAVTRYPALYAGELKAALAAYVGAAPSEIVTGCGSDDVLDSAIRAFAEPGERIALPDPTFPMIPIFARLNGLEAVRVPLTAEWDVDVERILAANARIIYLCSPNNPTGAALARASIEAIVERAPGLVIIDEAYAEFAGADTLDLVRTDRVLVTRTMSKAFGLAGLRIGYAVGAPALVAEVEKSRGPYKVTSLAERAALAAVRDDLPWVRARAGEAVEHRARLATALRALELDPLPSAANFVLVPVPGAAGVAAALRERGIAVRPFERLLAPAGTALDATGGDALRVSVAPWPMLQAFVDALAAVIA